jgi:1-acyl-sn-glycerol-3-phosphate acyltransferase
VNNYFSENVFISSKQPIIRIFTLMFTLNKLLKRLWAVWFMLVFSSFLLVMFPVFWLLLRHESAHPLVNKLRRIWAWWIVMLTGVDYDIRMEDTLDQNRQYIFTPNHSSILDIPFFAILWNDYFKFMAKTEFSAIPFFGIFFRTIDIAVDRNRKIGSYRALVKGKEAIEKGYSLIIFPEGTAQRNPPELLEFKNGPFKLAIEKQIPVVPVTFLDNWHLFLFHGDFTGNPGTSRVIVHRPIETKGLTDADTEKLKRQVFDIIANALKEEYGSKQAIGG